MVKEYVNNNKLFRNIDFLRFLFSIVIICYHFIGSLNSIDYNFNLYKKLNLNMTFAYLCVDFFFIISGFFLFLSYNKIIMGGGNPSLYKYIKNRIIRLWPPLCFAVCCYIIFFKLNLTLNLYQKGNLISLFLLNGIGFSNGIGGYGNIHNSWFVSSLFWISILYFLMLKFIKDKYLLYFILILITIHYYLFYMFYPTYNFYIDNISRAIAGIGLGIIISKLYIDAIQCENCKLPNSLNWKIIYNFLEIFLFIMLIKYLLFKMIFEYIIVILIFILLFILLIMNKGILSKLLDNKLSNLLGKYSYTIFIMHILIMDIFYNKFWNNRLYENIISSYRYLSYIIPIIISIIVGIITYYILEEILYKQNSFIKKMYLFFFKECKIKKKN